MTGGGGAKWEQPVSYSDVYNGSAWWRRGKWEWCHKMGLVGESKVGGPGTCT